MWFVRPGVYFGFRRAARLGVICFIAWSAVSCARFPRPPRDRAEVAASHFERAERASREMRFGHALNSLRSAFASGFDRPMDVARNEAFRPLIEDGPSRVAVRSLLRKHARETGAEMVGAWEPGAPILIHGRVLDADSLEPIARASVELVHADASGRYFKEDGPFNPRLFAYLTTSRDGKFRVKTIRPGTYHDDDGVLAPSHVHFSILAERYRDFNAEFLFQDDPLLTGDRTATAEREGLPIATRSGVRNGIPEYSVTLRLQPQAGGSVR